MSVPVFYAADMSAAVFTMSLAEDTSYPLLNLSSNLPTMLWKSSANTNGQWLKIDIGSAKACDFIAIAATNITSMDAVKLQYGVTDDGNFASPVDAVVDMESATTTPFVFTFTSVTKRYWRILFTATSSILPQIGLLLLGSKLALPHTYDWDFNVGDKEFTTSKKYALDGTLRTARTGGGRGKHQFKVSLTDDAFGVSWQALCAKTFGSANPFFWADDAGTIRVSHFAEDYLPISKQRYNITDLVQITLIDQSLS